MSVEEFGKAQGFKENPDLNADINKFLDEDDEDADESTMDDDCAEHCKANGMECTHKKVETEEEPGNGRGLQSYPPSLDWRQQGVMNPIRNQGSCGGCYSFSAVNALEAAHKIKTGKLVSLSEQQILDCSNRFGNTGCGGGLMTNSYKYLQQSQIVSRESYPYTAV